MREKLLWATLLTLGTALVASRAQSPANNQQALTNSGRYQLAVAVGLPSHEGVYRIDTTTGQTWVVGIHMYADHPQTSGWILIEEGGGGERIPAAK